MITNDIFADALGDQSLTDLSKKLGIARSNLARYKKSVTNPLAETWLISLARLGHVRVRNGHLVIKAPSVSREVLNEIKNHTA